MKLSTQVLAALAFTFTVSWSLGYDSPDFAKAESLLGEAPDLEQLRATKLGSHLAELALNLPAEKEDLKSRALVLAWLAGNANDRNLVVQADFYLRLGRFPETDPLLTGTANEQTAEAMVFQCASLIGSLEDEVGVSTLRMYVADLLVSTGMLPETTSITSRSSEETLWGSIDGRAATATAAVNPENSPDYVARNNGEMLAGAGEFNGVQSSLNGLLVMHLEGSEYAGGASKMLGTVAQSGRSGSTVIRFNQPVGPLMTGALSEVERFLALRYDGVPKGHLVTLGFEERTTMKDGPSAAVACALLLDSLIKGYNLASSFAVTGDMNADGAVQPVGGIDGKLRGAVRANCSHVAFPVKNIRSISDIFLMEGASKICEIQIFSVADFDEAFRLAVAESDRDAELAEAMRLFGEVAGVVGRPGGDAMISNPHVVQRLQKIVELSPNHVSASLLLDAATGKGPRHLSLAGSFLAIDRCIKPMNAVRESRDYSNMSGPLKDSIINLRRIRNTLDPRTKEVCDGIEDVYEALSEIEPGMQRNGPRFKSVMDRLQTASSQLDAAYAELRSNPEVQEELNM